MGNYIFAGVVAFIILMTIIGYVRGLVKSVFSLLSVVIVLTIVTILTPIARDMVKETPVYTSIRKSIVVYFEKTVGAAKDNDDFKGLGVKEQKNVIEELSLPQNIKDSLVKNNTEIGYKELKVDNFVDYIVVSITDKIVDSIVFIVLLIFVSIAVGIVINLLDLVAKLPVIDFFNKGGGAIFGFATALLFIWIICIIITAFGATEQGQKLLAIIDDNVLLSLIYNYNLLELAISSLF
ncbi:MAG: hypothetical protein E7254_01510 [Lachnospiraceae bacterium]|nr:hypothetical protein [Lachnospiraceae bacterium]